MLYVLCGTTSHDNATSLGRAIGPFPLLNMYETIVPVTRAVWMMATITWGTSVLALVMLIGSAT